MSVPDFNLLIQLDVLLAEGSVARAARRLRLSPSAMSRALTRLREATGDPLLVRAGRRLVPTPRAVELRHLVSRVVEDGKSVLRPADRIEPKRLTRTFTIRSSEGFVENFGARLLARVAGEAPSVRLQFVVKPDKDSAPLRDGTVDLETGVVESTTSPELLTRELFTDRLVGVVRAGHPLTTRRTTAAAYATGAHVLVSRRGSARSPVDERLDALRLERRIAVVVSGFSMALSLARSSDLIATVPERHTGTLRAGMHTFPLPLALPEFTVSLLWHPRQDADVAHRWMRECVREACAATK